VVDRIEAPVVVVAAGTFASVPTTTPLSFQDGVVVGLEIRVPPGPSGLMGFQILHSGVSVLPKKASEFIVTDNDKIEWPLSNFPTGNKWAVRAYNEDVYDHSIYLFFLIDELPLRARSIMDVPLPVQLDQPSTVEET